MIRNNRMCLMCGKIILGGDTVIKLVEERVNRIHGSRTIGSLHKSCFDKNIGDKLKEQIKKKL